MNLKVVNEVPKEMVHREFRNIRELLEMLMSEHAPAKHKIKMQAGISWNPPTDVFETETEVIVMVDIAGMDRRDISVLTDGEILTIQGVRNEVTPPGKKHFHKMEIEVGPFQKLIDIPTPIDSRAVFTNYTNGFLEIRLKKRFDESEERPDEKTKKKKIDIE